MRNAGLEEAQAGIKIAGRNINNLRYADGTTLMAESEEELKSLLMKVKVKSLSRVRLFVTPLIAARQASLSITPPVSPERTQDGTGFSLSSSHLDLQLEKTMATHSSTHAWKTPWMEEPGGLQSMGSRRVEHD